MMASYSNVCDDRPNTNNSFDGLIPTDGTKEASTENPVSVEGSQLGWTIYSRDTEPFPVPMIPPSSSFISPKRMSVSTFTQCGTPKPLVLPLRPYKQQPLPLERASPTPFPHQDGVSDEVPSSSESTHGRGNHDKETDNLKISTAQRLFKGKNKSPLPASTAVEGTLVIATAAVRAIELYGDKKEAGEEGGEYSSPEDVSLLMERGDRELSTWSGGYDEPGRRRSISRSKDKFRDEKSTDGQVILPLLYMTFSPMEFIYPNNHLNYQE